MMVNDVRIDVKFRVSYFKIKGNEYNGQIQKEVGRLGKDRIFGQGIYVIRENIEVVDVMIILLKEMF